MRHIFLSFLIIMCLALPSVSVRAAPPETTITVSPAITEWIVAPGKSIQKTVIVQNRTSDHLPVQAVAQEFSVLQTVAEKDKHLFNAAGWFTITESDFILRPKQKRKVTVRVTVPQKAEPGGHYATLYFRQLAPVSSQPQNQVIPRVGMLAMVVVEGNIHKRLRVETVQTPQNGNAIALNVGIRNVGNVHASPSGELQIKNWQGEVIKKVPLQAGFVLPRTERTFHHSWHPPGFGIYSVETHITAGSQKLEVLSTTIWWLPWQEAIITVLLLYIGWFWGFRIRHRWYRVYKEFVKKRE